MPIVDPVVLEKEAKAREAAAKSVPTQIIGGQTYFKGADDEWYTSHGEALDSLQRDRQIKEYLAQGLDEEGRSPEQVALSEEKARLLKKRESVLEQVREIDIEIGNLTLENFKSKGKSKKGK